MAEQLAHFLQQTVEREIGALQMIAETDAARRPQNGGWSRKQELGHLLDSVANNRIRFVRAALEPEYSGPSYDGDRWVSLHAYDDLPWATIVDLWRRENALLTHLIGRIPEDKLQTPCSIAGRPPVTLAFLIEDYVRHLQHHLDHILRREKMTDYPGAALGI